MPFSASRATSSVNIASKAGLMRSERKRFTVMWSRGVMPVSHMKQTFSLVARAIFLLE